MSADSERTTSAVPRYAYRVAWSPADEQYVATTLEWGPSLSWLDADPGRALEGLRMVVQQAVADLAEDGKAVPEALMERVYSGKVLLRMPASLHRTLTMDAAEEGVSLNQLVVARLSDERRTGLRESLITATRAERRGLLDRLADS